MQSCAPTSLACLSLLIATSPLGCGGSDAPASTDGTGGATAHGGASSHVGGAGGVAGGAMAQTPTLPASNRLEQVDVLIGTVGDRGRVPPGAVRPFGMLNFGPDPYDPEDRPWPPAIYDSENSELQNIRGFGTTHLVGAGCRGLGDFPLMPIVGEIHQSPYAKRSEYTSRLRPENIDGRSPAYFAGTLDSDVRFELTTTPRSGFARFQFPEQKQASILFDVGFNMSPGELKAHVEFVNDSELSGWVEGGGFCYSRNAYRVYFYAAIDEVASQKGTYNASALLGESVADGPQVGGFATINLPEDNSVQVKIGISYVSVEGAKANLETEIPGWDFDSVRSDSADAWNARLNSIRVDGGSAAEQRIFYSALYRSMIHPSTFSDVSGKYPVFTANSGGLHRLKHHEVADVEAYTHFSGWDVYRTQIPLLALLAPEVASGLGQWLVQAAADTAFGLPRWAVANMDSRVMIGDPAIPSLSFIQAFGGDVGDPSKALAAMVDTATNHRPGLEGNIKVQAPRTWHDDASWVLEYGIADFALARFIARASADETLHRQYMQDAQRWRTVFDSDSGWILNKTAEGAWSDEKYVEASKQQYLWLVPHNLQSLVTAMGGREAANARLDTLFQEIVLGIPGYATEHYPHGNEPSIHIPWVYNWTARPEQTQQVVRRIMLQAYSDGFAGLPGEDDLGTISAWYVFAALGMYPVIPGEAGFALSGPTFPMIELVLDGGRVVTIQGGSEGPSDARRFVQAVTIDGEPLESTWIDWSQLRHGGTLEYTMGPEASSWGTETAPPSFAEDHPL